MGKVGYRGLIHLYKCAGLADTGDGHSVDADEHMSSCSGLDVKYESSVEYLFGIAENWSEPFAFAAVLKSVDPVFHRIWFRFLFAF